MVRDIIAEVAIERPTVNGGTESVGEPINPSVGDRVALWRHTSVGYSGTVESWYIDHADVAVDGNMGPQQTRNDTTWQWVGFGEGTIVARPPGDGWRVEIRD